MKNTMLRSLSLLGVSLMMALSLSAQEAKVKTIGDKEVKYKSEELKTKDKKEEAKYKATELKAKDEKEKGKVKARVTPMHRTMVESTEMKKGETQVRTKEHMDPISTETATLTPTPLVVQPVEEPTFTPTPAVTPAAKPRLAAHKSIPHKRLAVRKSNAPRYVVRTRTKIVKDTVYVPGPEVQVPVVTTNTQYIHDTVELTRTDTVVKMQTQNTYTGYRVPRGDFKKVKLRKDKNTGDVWMKRKKE